MPGEPSELERWPGKSPEEIRDAYDEEEADTIEEMHWLKRRLADRTRRKQFGDVDGRVLDVACGTGRNFGHVPESAAVVGVDISPDMLARAREVATELGRSVELKQMDAQQLSFEADSFDYMRYSRSAGPRAVNAYVPTQSIRGVWASSKSTATKSWTAT